MRSLLHSLAFGLLIAFTALIIPSSVRATLMEFNGHSYEFIQLDSDISWTDARAAALAMTFKGESGYPNPRPSPSSPRA